MNPFKDSIFLGHLFHAYAQTDGSYAFPNSREGDMLKQAKREVEALLADKRLLDRGCIRTHDMEFGDRVACDRHGLDLRAAIRAVPEVIPSCEPLEEPARRPGRILSGSCLSEDEASAMVGKPVKDVHAWEFGVTVTLHDDTRLIVEGHTFEDCALDAQLREAPIQKTIRS